MLKMASKGLKVNQYRTVSNSYLDPDKKRLYKDVWEKEKMQVTSIFCFLCPHIDRSGTYTF